MLMIGALCLALLLPGGIMDQAGQQGDEQQIHGVLNGFVDAWNHHDAKAFAAVFSEDADFTNWRGTGASGRSKIEEFHAPLFATIFKNSHQTFGEIKIRFIRPDVAAVDVNWNLTGATDPQGNPRPPSQRIVELCDGEDRWKVARRGHAQSGHLGVAAAHGQVIFGAKSPDRAGELYAPDRALSVQCRI